MNQNTSPYNIEGRVIIGLTGGIGSGKSQVAKVLAARGYAIIDADKISRELTLPGGEAYSTFVKLMGTDDRTKIRELITSSPAKKKSLEQLLHPLIQEKTRQTILGLSKDKPKHVFYEAALLVETKSYEKLAGLWVVEAPINLRIERIMKRDSCTKEQAENLIATQTTDDARRKVATLVIQNHKSLLELEEQITQALKKFPQ